MQHTIRRLRLHRRHHGIAAACSPAHGRRIAPEGVHAGSCRCCALGAFGAHAEPVDGRQYNASHDVKRVYTTQGIPTCDEPSHVVIGQIYFLYFLRIFHDLFRTEAGMVRTDPRSQILRGTVEGRIGSSPAVESYGETGVALARCERHKDWRAIEYSTGEDNVPDAVADLASTG